MDRRLSILAVIFVVGALLMGALAATTVTGPAATPAPAASPEDTGLPAGTYTAQRFFPKLTFTLPAGWDIATDAPDYLEIKPAGSDIAGIHVFRGALPRAQDLDCPETPAPGVGSTSTEIVQWLRGLPGLVVSDPKLVTIGGLRGAQVDVGITEGWKASCPFADGAPTVPLWVDGQGGYAWVAVGNERLRLYLLDAPGGGTIIVDIDAFDGSVIDQLISDAMPIVRSFAFDTAAPSPLLLPSPSPGASPAASPSP